MNITWLVSERSLADGMGRGGIAGAAQLRATVKFSYHTASIQLRVQQMSQIVAISISFGSFSLGWYTRTKSSLKKSRNLDSVLFKNKLNFSKNNIK